MDLLTLQISFGGLLANGLIEALRLILAVLAFVLLIISVVAYRRNKAKRLQFVSAGFGLFFVRVLLVEHATYFLGLPLDVVDVSRILLDLGTLMLFFLAVVKP